MINKIKSRINKKYAVISVYVIVTVLIILMFASAIFQIGNILKAVTSALQYISCMLTPLFIGIIIAYITNPLVSFIEKVLRKFKPFKLKNEKIYRSIAVFSCILLIIFGILLLFGTFIFSITKQIFNMNIDNVINTVTNYVNSFSDSLKSLEGKLSTYNIQSSVIDQYIGQFSSMLTNSVTSFANNIVANTMNISGYISNFVFGLIIGIYLLLDKDEIFGYGNKLLKALFSEKTEGKIKSGLSDINYIFSGYIRGTVLDASLMCVILSVTLTIIGIKFGVLIGILAGICNLVPYFGPIVAFSGTVIFGVLNGQYNQVIIAIITLLIIQQVDGNIIQPKLLSNSIAIKPVLILIAVIIGAQIYGPLGMVLAVPVTALIKLFLERFIEQKLKKKELLINKNNHDADSDNY